MNAGDPAKLSLPAGWSIDVDGYGRGHDVLTSPNRYMATIDWERRCFRSGISISGKAVNKKKYAGRGWKQSLLDAAVKWLEALESP